MDDVFLFDDLHIMQMVDVKKAKDRVPPSWYILSIIPMTKSRSWTDSLGISGISHVIFRTLTRSLCTKHLLSGVKDASPGFLFYFSNVLGPSLK